MTIEWAEKDHIGLIRRANDETLGKRNVKHKPLTIESAQALVLSGHSTLEMCSLIIDDDIRADVSHQMVRATAYHPRHACQSGRPDWVGKPRSGDPSELKMYLGKWDIKALITMSHERLCFKAMKETREFVEEVKFTLLHSDDVLMQAVGWALVPHCVMMYDCPFLNRSCGWFHDAKRSPELSVGPIKVRYDDYNNWFVRSMEAKNA